MKTFAITVAVAAALGLSACAKKDEAGTEAGTAAGTETQSVETSETSVPTPDDFAAQCATFAVDGAAVDAITSAGATMDVFCGCLSLAVDSLPAEEAAGVKTAMTVVAGRISSDVSTDSIVDAILAAGFADGSTEEARVLAGQVDDLGAVIGSTLETMESNGGACAG